MKTESLLLLCRTESLTAVFILQLFRSSILVYAEAKLCFVNEARLCLWVLCFGGFFKMLSQFTATLCELCTIVDGIYPSAKGFCSPAYKKPGL